MDSCGFFKCFLQYFLFANPYISVLQASFTVWKQKLYKLVNKYYESALDFKRKIGYSINNDIEADRFDLPTEENI